MTAITEVLLGGFAAALVLGASAQVTRFCPQGGLRESLLEGKPARMAAYVAAIGVAMLAVAGLQLVLGQALAPSRPAYLGPELPWGRHVLGGVLFGAGMVLARGCPLRTLVRVGQGSAQALVLLVVMAVAAYVMTRTALYGAWFAPWLSHLSVDLRRWGFQGQGLDALLGLHGLGARVALGASLGLGLLGLAWRGLPWRQTRALWFGAVLIGLMVATGYAVTAGPWGARALDEAAFLSQPPDGMGVQSFSFAGPLSDAAYFALHPASQTLSFGVVAVLGALGGALLAALLRREFRVEGFAAPRDMARSLFGAVLAGGGAVLGLGCTVGHGLSGISVLSVGSMLGLVSIFIGALLTMRLEGGLMGSKLQRSRPLAFFLRS